MYKEVLTAQQGELLPLLRVFSKKFYLVGGTAIALQIGHRRSIDFDLFTKKALGAQAILNQIKRSNYRVNSTLTQSSEELTIVVEGIKTTFFSYPFSIRVDVELEDIIKMPGLLDLSAMKAYAMGRRNKWKDYVDLYFLLKYHLPLRKIVKRAKLIFGEAFNEKLFREQLCFFEDIDYSESIDYLGQAVQDEIIRQSLIEIATS